MDPLIMSQLARMYQQEKLDHAALHRDDQPLWEPLQRLLIHLERMLTAATDPRQVVMPRDDHELHSLCD